MESNQPALLDQLQACAARMALIRCPLCGETRWDDGCVAFTPFVRDQTLDTDEPYKTNALLLSAVFTCQTCQGAQWLTLGGIPPLRPLP
jgi:hypothetical protein